MIKKGTVVNVADNSGAKKVRVYQLYGGSFRGSASIGDEIGGSVVSADPFGKLKKGSKVRMVVVRVTKDRRRKDGSSVRFDDNAGVIIEKTGEPVGNRIFGPIGRELQAQKKFAKIVSGAKYVV